MSVIGIDCRFAAVHAGLGTYTRAIVQALSERDDPWSYVLFVRSAEESWLRELGNPGRITIIEAPIPHYSLREQWNLPQLIGRSGCDLLYAPHFNVPLRCPVPFIATVHDLILHRFPGEAPFWKRLAYRLVLGHAMRRARSIITISQATKTDIGTLYGESSALKTTVIAPGLSSAFTPQSSDKQTVIRRKFNLRRPFLLYVGGRKHHKNVPMLIRSFLEADLQAIDLVLVSNRMPSDVPCERIRYLEHVSDDDLPALYSAALGFLTATLAEGFGFPIIEAMACGCPVLATNVGPIPEVCGGHALIVEPNPEDLIRGIRNIAFDDSRRSEDRRSALVRYAREYSWEKAAGEIASILRSELRM